MDSKMEMNNRNITALLSEYLTTFPTETNRLQVFIDYLTRENQPLFDRKNFYGHITASAFIVNADLTHLLLIKHKALGRWLQPGGHVDVSDTDLLKAAIREASEETGIAASDLLYRPINALHPFVPFDIDPHLIPDNSKKLEPAHYHHDHRYVFVYNGRGSLQNSKEETDGMMWVNLQELELDATFGGVVQKLRHVFN